MNREPPSLSRQATILRHSEVSEEVEVANEGTYEPMSKRVRCCVGVLLGVSLAAATSIAEEPTKPIDPTQVFFETTRVHQIHLELSAAEWRAMKRLEEVNLRRAVGTTTGALVALAAGCPGLKRVNLSWTSGTTVDGAQALAKGCPGLEVLNLGRTGVTLPAAFKRAHPKLRTANFRFGSFKSLKVIGAPFDHPGAAGLGQDTTWWQKSSGTALPDPIEVGWKPRTGFQTFEDMLHLRGWYNTTREYPEVPGEAPDRRRRRARGYDYANARTFYSVGQFYFRTEGAARHSNERE